MDTVCFCDTDFLLSFLALVLMLKVLSLHLNGGRIYFSDLEYLKPYNGRLYSYLGFF